MTQNTEQKVRTREEQVEALCSEVYGNQHPHISDRPWLLRHLKEAEARGAAEQRRKDAEGQEPVAWIFKIRAMGTDAWIEHTSTTKVDPIPGMRRDILPLYTHPANVTAMDEKG